MNFTPSVPDDDLYPRAMPSRAPQDDHMLKHVNKDIIRDAENAVRRSGMEPSAPENYDLLKQAVNDAATRSMYMRDPFTRSNRSPGAHDWTYESGLPYRSPLDRLYPRAEQDTWSRAEMLRALRSSKGEDQDQDLRPRDEWVAVSPPLQSKPHEYSYQSRYPRLRTDLTALNLNPLPSIWSNKLPPMKGSSPEVLNK